jgi:FtsH-binding integral membrane protein
MLKHHGSMGCALLLRDQRARAAKHATALHSCLQEVLQQGAASLQSIAAAINTLAGAAAANPASYTAGTAVVRLSAIVALLLHFCVMFVGQPQSCVHAAQLTLFAYSGAVSSTVSPSIK